MFELADFDIGVGWPLLADSRVCCLTPSSLMPRCTVVTTIILTARDKELKIKLKVQHAKMSPNRRVKTHQTTSLRNSFRKPAQARKCLGSSSVTSRRQSYQTGRNEKCMASAKLPLKLVQGWIFGRKLQNVVHQSALWHTHDNLHDVGRSLISSCRIHGWLNKLKLDLVNNLFRLTIPGAVGLHSKEVLSVPYSSYSFVQTHFICKTFHLISFVQAACMQMFEIPRLHQRGNMWPVWRSTCPLLNKSLPIQVSSLHCAAKVVALLGFAGDGRGRVRRRQQGVSPTRDQDASHGVAVTWRSQVWWTTHSWVQWLNDCPILAGSPLRLD